MMERRVLDSICSPTTPTTPFFLPSLPPSKTESSSLSNSPVETSRPFPAMASPTRGSDIVDPYPVGDGTPWISLEDWIAAYDAENDNDDEPAPAAPPPVNAWDDAPGRTCSLHYSLRSHLRASNQLLFPQAQYRIKSTRGMPMSSPITPCSGKETKGVFTTTS